MRSRACILLLVALLLCGPLAAARGVSEDLEELSNALTLGAAPRGPALRALFLGTSHDPLEAGALALGDDMLRDPLALLELPEIPIELLGEITVDELGPIHGRVTDVPPDNAIAAIALEDGPIAAEELRPTSTRAEVRDGTDDELQLDDLAALLGEDP